MKAIWELTQEKRDEVLRRLIEASHWEDIVLFGSYARGTAGRDSDLDLLIVVPDEVTYTFLAMPAYEQA